MLTYDFHDLGHGTLYGYLYRKIRGDILSGTLKAGERMPSKRAFAQNLGVSVITVETAYSQLTAEGYLYSKPGSGFYVEKIEDALLLPSSGHRGADPGHAEVRSEDCLDPSPEDAAKSGGSSIFTQDVHERKKSIPEYKTLIRNRGSSILLDLSQGSGPPDKFPFSVWSKLMKEVMRDRRQELLSRSPGTGIYDLRAAIADYLAQFRDLIISPDQIVIGAGTEYLYGLLIRLLGPDRVYAVETPGYPKTARIYESNGVQVRGISMDKNGLDVSMLRQSDADVVHISPSHQFPTGITMPVPRRSELLSWCRTRPGERFIIEDDYDSEFRLSGRPIPTLMSIDRHGCVIYLNTFTKSITPSIRISYMVLPEALMSEYRKALGFYSCTVPNFEQYLLAEFIRQGYFEKHINRMRGYYRRRRDMLLAAIQKSPLQSIVKIRGADSGLHFLMEVKKDGCSEENLTRLASAAGVRILGTDRFRMNESVHPAEPPSAAPPCMVVNYAGLTDRQILSVPELLEKAWMND